MSLSVEIEKKLGDFRLNVAFEAENGVLALLGASGCGKSMTLKCIAGIVTPDRGKIVLDGVTLYDSAQKVNLPPQKRRVGYLFQQYALFPNMTVEQNIAVGVRDRKKAKQTAAEMMERMRLSGLEKLKPHQLSGGQQQRTALARILVNEPEVLLLDEPFSALDSHLRLQMESEVREIVREFGKPVVMVSHSQDEVYRLSDRVAVMAAGRVESVGPKKEIFAQPQTCNGAVLTGCRNISRIRFLDDGRVWAEEWNTALDIPAGDFDCAGIRARDIEPSEDGIPCEVEEEIENPFSVTVTLHPRGAQGRLFWEMDKQKWSALRGKTQKILLPAAHIQRLKESL